MYICAVFSGFYGWWNEQLRSDRGFVTAIKHLVKANVCAMREIASGRTARISLIAIFVQSESTEYFHAARPAAIGPAAILNSKRFLSLDLN